MKFLSLRIPLQISFALINGDLFPLALKFTRKGKFFYTSSVRYFCIFLYIKRPVFLSGFNQNWNKVANFIKIPL